MDFVTRFSQTMESQNQVSTSSTTGYPITVPEPVEGLFQFHYRSQNHLKPIPGFDKLNHQSHFGLRQSFAAFATAKPKRWNLLAAVCVSGQQVTVREPVDGLCHPIFQNCHKPKLGFDKLNHQSHFGLRQSFAAFTSAKPKQWNWLAADCASGQQVTVPEPLKGLCQLQPKIRQAQSPTN